MEPRSVDVNGIKLAYLEEGTGPLVVLAHGFPDTAYTWDKAMGELAKAGFRAVAPFMRGIHPSGIAGPYDSEQYARDLLGLIDALGGPAVLVGHDWGASASYSAATLGGDKIRLLITLAIPHPASIRPGPSAIWALRHALFLRRDSAAAKIRKGNYRYIDELWHRWSPAWKDLPADETRAVKEAYAHPGCLEAAAAYYKSISPRLPASQRKRIRIPAVAFAGEHDLLKPRQYEKARGWFLASYEVVQLPGGHFLHREHPAEFNAELVRVVREHDQRAKATA